MDIEKFATEGLSEAQNLRASYCDIRFEIINDENISFSDGQPQPIELSQSAGWAVRVLKNGAWGFVSGDNPDVPITIMVGQAIKIAEASAKLMREPVELSARPAETGEYESYYNIDPFAIPMKEKIEFLADLDSAMEQEGLNSRSCFADFHKIEKWFFSSEGSKIHQKIIQTGGGMTLGQAESRHERAERSYPRPSGQYQSRGYELLKDLGFKPNVPRIAEEVRMLLKASPCPEKTTKLVLSGDIAALVMHESIGHPLELDRVFGMERNFSGISFATPDKRNNLHYGSPLLTVMADPTDTYGVGSFGWDDEGVKARRSPLIEKGILRDYLSSRETAARLGLKSTAAMRAQGWQNIPICRMTNTVLLPGNKTMDDMISEVDDGILMAGPSSWSIDDLRKNFQFGCEIGWIIKNGRLKQPVKNPTFTGCTTQFWNNLDAVGNLSEFTLWGTPNCGKGQPGQTARTGEGTAPLRFHDIQVGG